MLIINCLAIIFVAAVVMASAVLGSTVIEYNGHYYMAVSVRLSS